MSLRGRISKSLKWQAINIVGRQILSLVVFTTLARILDPAAFGLLALISIYSYFASMLADLGLGTALVQRKTLERAHLDTAFWFNLGCNTLLCVATMIFAAPISMWLGEPMLTPLLRWASIGLMFGAMASVQSTLFVKDLDFRRPTIRALIGNVVGGCVGVAMALAGYGVWSLVGQLLAASFAASAFVWMSSKYRPSLSFSLRHLRELLAVSSSVFANALIWFLSSRLDQIVIGKLAGAPALGLYVVAGKIPEMVKAATQQPVVEVSVPALAQLQDDYPKMREAIYRGMELNSFVIFPLFLGIAATSRDLVPFLFGTKWSEAGNLCALLSIYSLVNALQLFFYPALLAAGVTGKYVALNLIQTLGVFVACLAGVQWGTQHLVLALTLNSVIISVPAIIFLRRRIGLSPLRYWRPCFAPAFGSLLMAAAVWCLQNLLPATVPLILRLVAEIAVGATIYCAFAFTYSRATAVYFLMTIRHAAIGTRPQSA
jgi:O-antigen/teichoic acid export membrane protein